MAAPRVAMANKLPREATPEAMELIEQEFERIYRALNALAGTADTNADTAAAATAAATDPYYTHGTGNPEGVVDGVLGALLVNPDGEIYQLGGAARPAPGDVSGPAASVDGEVVLFSGVTGKALKRASGTGRPKLTAGVQSVGAIDLAAEVTGRLPLANVVQGSALSVLGVTGNATADLAAIAAGTDAFVLRRSGTALAFGLVDGAAGINAAPVSYTPTWSAVSVNPAIGNGSLTGFSVQIGRIVVAGVTLVTGSSTTYGTGNWIFTVPIAFRAGFNPFVSLLMIDGATAKAYIGGASAASTTTVALKADTLTTVDASTPFVWASGDTLILSLIYPVT